MNEINRRAMLAHFANGFGMLGLAGLLADEARAAAPPARADAPASPLALRPPHFAAKAKRLIFLFMSGGPSHVDTFDPKPRLARDNGKPLPFPMPKLERTRTGNLLGSPFKFNKHGRSGIEVSELFPEVASCVDDLCIIRSLVADNINHNGACLQMNTGEQAFSRPSLGSWLLYGLGSENQSLPGFVVISPSQPAQGAPLWSSSFLPAAYQGTLVADLKNPIADLRISPAELARQRQQLDALRKLNELHRRRREEDSRLSARIASFELAFRMQTRAPEAFAVASESATTKRLYGLNDRITETFGTQCLMARRLVERGVRCVQVYHTQTSRRASCQLWDQHGGLRSELRANCAATDRPIAGLLKDLKARGLLKDTLVLWGGEFGRTPTAEGTDGREHHPFGFTMWLAGAGIKGGMVHGATDDFGWHAVKDKVHVHDLHATLLHLLGLDHERLTYRHAGRDYRLTDVHGNVVRGILAQAGRRFQEDQRMPPLRQSHVPGHPCRRGKVRDVYDLGDRLVLVASDRISAFDWVLPTPIPDKGRVLTALTLFWLEHLGVPHHLLSTNLADMGPAFAERAEELTGRTCLVRKANVVPIECVARGYLAGSGWKEYVAGGTVCGISLPPGLRQAERLPQPIFTPATKEESGHDQNISFAHMADLVGGELADELRRRTLAIYNKAAEHARSRGLILADTKFEWGRTAGGEIILIDEVLTPDSSRFWAADTYQVGSSPPSFDKQFVRDYLETTTWDKNSPPPELPDEVVARTRAKYVEAYERLTGKGLP